MIILEENFKWHLEAFASELFLFFSLSFVTNIKDSDKSILFTYLGC